jgi:hypothetical protein
MYTNTHFDEGGLLKAIGIFENISMLETNFG